MTKEVYLRTHQVVREEYNGEETTYFIEGEMSVNGKDWEECLFIWDGDLGDGGN